MTRICLIFLLLFPLITAAQDQPNPASLMEAPHELTIYIIPPKARYDWSSPRSLYRSYVKNYKKNLFSKNNYLLGHAFLELRSPLLKEPLQTGMRSSCRQEQKQYVLKDNYGLAILGAEISGRLENSAELELKKERYSRKGRMAFLTLFISEPAAARMIDFFAAYVGYFDTTGGSGPAYGGAFWPRYRGEGAGCSAFVVSFLDIAGLLRPFFEEWKVEVNIPMSLIGGPYNEGNEVRFRDIKKYREWSRGGEGEQEKYEPFEIYDPFLMFEWVGKMRTAPDTSGLKFNVVPAELHEAKGIIIDGRNIPIPENERLFEERKTQSIFIDHYFQQGIPKTEPEI
jgi:hypothetical protein